MRNQLGHMPGTVHACTYECVEMEKVKRKEAGLESTTLEVYIAELGCYENRYVAGIYDSPERAMGEMPGQTWTRTIWTHYPDWPSLTPVEHSEEWVNELDWDDACVIKEVVVTATGPLRPVDEILLQVMRPGDRNGGWECIPITQREADIIWKGFK